jgi:hypothetical protein
MRVTILHVPGCPNVVTLQDRLVQAIGSDDVELTLRLIDSEDLATEVGMTGSPTLLIDGVDPFAEPGRSASLSCRLYRDEAGHVAGAPSVARLRRALDLPAGPKETIVVDDDNSGADGDCCAGTDNRSLPIVTRGPWPPAAPKNHDRAAFGPLGSLAAWRARATTGDPAGRAVHQAILRAFAATGRPPQRAALDQIATSHGAGVAKILAELEAADVIRLDPAGQIRVAYPFSAIPTRHPVQLAGGVTVWAMCAVDALGISAMLDTDAVITSIDPGNEQPVTVTVHGDRYGWDPLTAVVFLPAAAGDGPLAESCCTDLNFFTTPASAQAWITAHPALRGEVLDPASAERLGRRIFGALLATDRETVTAP